MGSVAITVATGSSTHTTSSTREDQVWFVHAVVMSNQASTRSSAAGSIRGRKHDALARVGGSGREGPRGAGTATTQRRPARRSVRTWRRSLNAAGRRRRRSADFRPVSAGREDTCRPAFGRRGLRLQPARAAHLRGLVPHRVAEATGPPAARVVTVDRWIEQPPR
jgi:hypothetical protein